MLSLERLLLYPRAVLPALSKIYSTVFSISESLTSDIELDSKLAEEDALLLRIRISRRCCAIVKEGFLFSSCAFRVSSLRSSWKELSNFDALSNVAKVL